MKRGDVFIVYDEATETANIVPKEGVRSISEEEGVPYDPHQLGFHHHSDLLCASSPDHAVPLHFLGAHIKYS